MKVAIKRYTGSIAAILLLTIASVLLLHRKFNTQSIYDLDFAPKVVSAVDRILITRGNDSILLVRLENDWILNSAAIARSDRINFLMESLSRIEIVSPVAKKAREHALQLFHDRGKRVQLYARNKIEMDFSIVYDSSIIRGTYILPQGSEDPFMVRLKGYAGENIEDVFTIDYKSWQDNMLFDFAPDEIKEIIVEYPEKMNESFRIARNEDGDADLSGMSATIPKENTDIQEITDYLLFFSNIHFEYPEDNVPDSLVSGIPFVELRLISNTMPEVDLRGYRASVYGESSGVSVSYFFGVVRKGKDTVILDYQDMDPILRQLDDFQKK